MPVNTLKSDRDSIKLEDIGSSLLNPATEETLQKIAGEYALQIKESGVYTYIGKAPIGSVTSGAVWQIKRIDETSGLAITWADGDNEFNNIWDNYASLTYA